MRGRFPLSKSAAWITICLVSIVVAIELLFVAAYRFAGAAVLPAPLPPDYAVQAAIAYSGCVIVLAIGAAGLVLANRNTAARRRIVGGTVALVIVAAVIITIAAFIFSAR